jgi:hypothetical protein
MKIVTSEFIETIETLINNLQPEDFPDAEEYKLAQKYNALPLGVDLLDYVFMTPKGEVIWEDYEGEFGSANDLQSLIRVLVAGKKRYPQFERFIPQRSDDSKTCPACKGSGIMPHSKDLSTGKEGKCFICAGLGWITEEFWKEFNERQKELKNSE